MIQTNLKLLNKFLNKIKIICSYKITLKIIMKINVYILFVGNIKAKFKMYEIS